MAHFAIVHVQGQDPIEGEIDEIPDTRATIIIVKNAKRRGNRDIEWKDPRTTTLIFPFSHVVSLEVSSLLSEQEIVNKHGFDIRSTPLSSLHS